MITMSELLKGIGSMPDDGLDKRVVFIDVDDVIFDTTGYLRDVLRGQVCVSEYKKALSDFRKVPLLCGEDVLCTIDKWFSLNFIISYGSDDEMNSKLEVLKGILERDDISYFAVKRFLGENRCEGIRPLSVSPVIISNDLYTVKNIWDGVYSIRVLFKSYKDRDWDGFYFSNWKNLMFLLKKLR